MAMETEKAPAAPGKDISFNMGEPKQPLRDEKGFLRSDMERYDPVRCPCAIGNAEVMLAEGCACNKHTRKNSLGLASGGVACAPISQYSFTWLKLCMVAFAAPLCVHAAPVNVVVACLSSGDKRTACMHHWGAGVLDHAVLLLSGWARPPHWCVGWSLRPHRVRGHRLRRAVAGLGCVLAG